MSGLRRIGSPVKTVSRSEYGGKAVNLMKLAQRDDLFNVPDGIAVPGDMAAELLDRVEERSGKELESMSFSSVRHALEEVPVPEQVREVEEALERFDEPLAVRSSAPSEDSGENSFAGVLESRIGVTRDRLEEAIKDVVASPFTERARRYRSREGSGGRIETGVIVQEMKDLRAGGVVYSTNPGGPEHLYAEIGPDADSVVKGCRADAAKINKRERETEEYTENLEERPVDAGDIESIARAVDRAGEILSGSRDVSGIDVEFGVTENDRVVVLQARPLTGGTGEEDDELMPELDDEQVLGRTDKFRGSGSFSGPAVVVEDADPYPGEGPGYRLKGYSRGELEDLDSSFGDGYVLVTPCINEELDRRTPNKEAIVTTEEGITSHAAAVAAEKGMLYGGMVPDDVIEELDTGVETRIDCDGQELVYSLDQGDEEPEEVRA
ncbi:MAG: PEP/pyruvate-binding domain-containing protein [Candidatus Nanohaloarchaea archaeon]